MNNFKWPKSLTEKFRALPTDPQEATWECETCGVITPQRFEVDGVDHFNRRLMCPCQEAARDREEKEKQRREWAASQSLHTYSWLGSRWADASLVKKTFENFQMEKQPDAYTMTRLYAANPQGTLVLYGTFGTGKTHLLAAVCNETLSKYNRTSLFTTAPDLFGAILQRIAHSEDYYDLVERAAKAPFFVIDDVDKSKHSEFKEEIYFAIIDKRTKRGLPTAISTNRLDELACFVGGAVCSRLQIGQIPVEMIGSDYREEL